MLQQPQQTNNPTTPPKKPLPPVATTASIGGLLMLFAVTGGMAAFSTYEVFAGGNHDPASLFGIFLLAIMSSGSMAGAYHLHTKANVPPGVQTALDTSVMPVLQSLVYAASATLSHVMQPTPTPLVNAQHYYAVPTSSPPPVLPVGTLPDTYLAPQPPVTQQQPVQPPQPYQQPYTPIMMSNATSAMPGQVTQFVPYQQPAPQWNTQAVPPGDMSRMTTQSVPAIAPILDPRWNDSNLMGVPTRAQGQ